MQRSKQHALMFLLGAILTGGVMGFAVARTLGATDAPTACPAQRDLFASAIGLTEAQKAGVDSILDQRNTHLRQAMAPVRPQLDSIRNAARDQIRQLLTPEQRQKFEAHLARQDAEKERTSSQGAKQ